MTRKATLPWGENEDHFEITIENIPIKELEKIGRKIRTRLKTFSETKYLKFKTENIIIYFISGKI